MNKSRVTGCARCGEDHDVAFVKFKNPTIIGGHRVTHWGMCPVRTEPILMYMEEKKNAVG